MGKNRDRLSIVASIMEAANSSACKTKIMAKANLSFALLEKYLDICLRAGFLEANGPKYILTEQGATFLKKYKQLTVHYNNAQRMFNNLIAERERLAQSC